MYREIEDHEPLFFMLPAVAVEKEKQEIIEKIIELLCSLDCYKYDFNRKDSNEIPFIDKVISSENPALIYFINHVPKENLTYHTGLYKIAESVQDPKFKAELQKLDFDCKEWKEAAEMCFCAAIRKLLPIIKSPLFNQDKMVLQAWEIAKKARNGVNSKTDFAQLLCNEFIDDISHTTMFKIMKEAQEIDNSSRNNNSPSRNSGYGNYPDDYTEWPEPLGLRF